MSAASDEQQGLAEVEEPLGWSEQRSCNCEPALVGAAQTLEQLGSLSESVRKAVRCACIPARLILTHGPMAQWRRQSDRTTEEVGER